MALKAGAAHLYPRTASCDVAYAWFKARGQISEYPAVGAQVFFGTRADLVHTGLVVSYDADYVYTVEGNTNDNGSREGDGVYAKKRARRDAYLVGYGYPAFPGGLVSADPAAPRPAAPTPAVPASAKPAGAHKAPKGSTPNITAALTAGTVKARTASLTLVAARGGPEARRQAKAALAAQAALTAAMSALAKLEVK